MLVLLECKVVFVNYHPKSILNHGTYKLLHYLLKLIQISNPINWRIRIYPCGGLINLKHDINP